MKQLKPSHFVREVHAAIFAVLRDFFRKEGILPTLQTLIEKASADTALKGIGVEAEIRIIWSVADIGTEQFEYAVEKVLKNATHRAYLNEAESYAAKLAVVEPGEDGAIHAEHQRRLDEIADGELADDGIKKVCDSMVEFMQQIANGETQGRITFSTGFPGVDEMTDGGFAEGELVTIAGRTRAGKPHLGFNLL